MPAVVDLVPRAAAPDLPMGPLNETMAKAVFQPTQRFSLDCLYAELVIAVFLLGVFTVLLIRYWQHSKEDSWWVKGTVMAASTLLYGMQGFHIYLIHYFLIVGFGTYRRILAVDKYGYFVLFDGIICAIVQSFFAHRAFRLAGRNWFILGILIVLILTGLAGSTATVIIFANLPNLLHAGEQQPPELLWLSATMVADMIITGCILYGLWKSRTGWANTDRVIGRLIRMTLEAQIPPLLLAIAWLVEFAVTPSSLLGAVFMTLQSLLYCLGLVYSLNSRQRWKTGQNVTMNNGGETFQLSHRAAATIMVDVETETYETRIDRPAHQGVNRVVDSNLERIQDVEWDDDEKTEALGSINSATFNAKVTTPTPRSNTPPSGIVTSNATPTPPPSAFA